MRKMEHLDIIEIPYGDLNWGSDPEHKRQGIYSDIQHWKKYRELDDYKLCGVYLKSGVPYTIHEIVYEPNKSEEVYLTLTRQVSDAVYKSLSSEHAILLTGGYCKDAVAVCGGIQRAIGTEKKIGIVYLDAHSDMSTPALTHTGILGGMDLASILGIDLAEWRIAAGLAVPFDDSNIILSDFREASVDDDGALPLVLRSNITWIKTDEFENIQIWKDAVEKLANKVDAIYLHVDADVLNRMYVPNAACVADGGISVHTLMSNIRTVMQTGKVLVYGSYGFYFDTDIPGQDSLTLSGMRTISAGLDEWKNLPF